MPVSPARREWLRVRLVKKLQERPRGYLRYNLLNDVAPTRKDRAEVERMLDDFAEFGLIRAEVSNPRRPGRRGLKYFPIRSGG
jgi:hypothetical protein